MRTTLTLEKIDRLYEDLPAGYNGEDFTRGQAFTYGEVTVDALRVLLERCEKLRGCQDIDCFLDLGSGCGKTVLQSLVLLPQLRRSIGVEMSSARHKTAAMAKSQLNVVDPEAASRAFFVNSDAQFAVAAVASADVIWVSNTCFPEELNRRIAYLIDSFARPGALICYSVELPCVRRTQESPDHVSMPCTWSVGHRALLHKVAGPIPCLEIDRTFAVWALRGQGASALVKFIELMVPLFLVVGSLVGTMATFLLQKAKIRDMNNELQRLENQSSKAPDLLPVQFLVPAISAALLARQELDPGYLIDALFGNGPTSGQIGPLLAQAERDYYDGLDIEDFKLVCNKCDAVAKKNFPAV